MNKCIFLDRDGVLNEDRVDYVYRLDQLVLPDGVVEALQRLKRAGFLLIVVTNQSGIAKGIYTADDVRGIHAHLQALSGGALDALYFAPHHPDYTSQTLTRKPDSLMLEKAIARYRVDVAQSWMVGDAGRDIIAGQRAGLRTIHVTGHPTALPPGIRPTASAASLLAASDLILAGLPV